VIEVVVSGARGRLGSRICALVKEASDMKLAGELEYDTPDRSAIQAGRVLISAATKGAALEDTALASSRGAAILVATTGFDSQERATLEAHAKRVPLLIAPNLSLGVAVLQELVARASAALADYDLEVLELHHNKKKDAPSGTAWALARTAASARGQDIEQDAVLARAGETGARGRREIGMQSIRGGDIVGDHTVYLVGATERLELTHRAQSRDTFAAGAVQAARFLGTSDRKPGLYTMRHVLGLDRL
jgi:4-hydroxy-tetrahydrodipicolinate reductase